ncbi:MAG: energy transducer TonB [Flavobacteriaceae bacterium]|nr:energy transducer TonB [Flavobacteriaceae bacterium]MDG1911373.1 energy transducer TonB [Flavobacteriaceae bacterium]
MEILNTPHKKKSAVLTGIFAVLVLLLFFVLGLTYYDPPISYGMEVNFGTLAQGSGSVQPKKPTAAQPSVVQEKQVEEKQQVTTPPVNTTEKTADVVTEKESTVAVPTKQKTPEEIIPDKKTPEKPVETSPEKVVPQVSEATKSVVSNLLKNKTQEGEQSAGEGDDAVQGDKGKLEGNPYATSYYSTAGLGGRGKGYGLNGRNLQSNGKVVQECNQEGTVVVRITVNNQGNVIAAEPGVKGSTNTHPCLMEPAKKTALLHKWYPDNNAPTQQIGFVVIQFKLGE